MTFQRFSSISQWLGSYENAKKYQRLLRSRQCWDWRDDLASAERFRAFRRFGRSLVDRTHVKFIKKIKVVCSVKR